MEKNIESQGSERDPVQGEGDYESARRYDRDVKRYVKTADVERAAREAEPRSEEEAEDLEAAEDVGRSRGKGETAPPD
ncbi:MAG: hypothetical protein JO341_14805 [Gammaproteobacteria bacterium]|nr:hypothetical protein [Gammaproteobacteria bacterium]MBV9622276.1 hypothetical protein [Gammaproteobacteria bacterium]